MSYNLNKLKTRIDEIFEETVEIRRHLHMYPELGEHEEKTAAFIQKKLTELGIPFEKNVAGHGISAVIYGKTREHGAAIRADIDALPLTEKTEVPFRSKHEGVMHACGHDTVSYTHLDVYKRQTECCPLYPAHTVCQCLPKAERDFRRLIFRLLFPL